MARSVETIIKEKGAVPATIALVSGKVHIGVDDTMLEQISDPTNNAVKVSKRDLAYTLQQVLLYIQLGLRCFHDCISRGCC